MAAYAKSLPDNTVLLFFKNYETDKFFKYDRYLKRLIRPLFNSLHHRQKTSGFVKSFELMCGALRGAAYNVRINDYRTAARHPDHPVGLVGYPALLDEWTLRNPAVLGPSLVDHPLQSPGLIADNDTFKRYAVLAPWTHDMFRPVFGDACFEWFAGIDAEAWPDQSGSPKTYDFLVYDKIRWDHDALAASLLDPILAKLTERGLTYHVLRYGQYDHAIYHAELKNARGMVFLCEHETQGLAYQEALASGVPILAWDRGVWADPLWQKFMPAAPPASSVPFFSPVCGERFVGLEDFDGKLDLFMARRDSYRPRSYVLEHLSPAESARIYAEQYFSLRR